MGERLSTVIIVAIVAATILTFLTLIIIFNPDHVPYEHTQINGVECVTITEPDDDGNKVTKVYCTLGSCTNLEPSSRTVEVFK